MSTVVSLTDPNEAFQEKLHTGDIANDSTWNIYPDIIHDLGLYRSDAVGKNDMYMEGAVAFLVNWHDKNDSDSDREITGFEQENTYRSSAFSRAHTSSFRREQAKKNGRLPDYLKKRLYYSNRQDDEDTTENVREIPVALYLIPYVGFESSKFAPTIGLDGQFVLVSMLPGFLYFSTYIQWHLIRDLYAGVFSEFTIYPLDLATGNETGFSMSLPVWIKWQYQRYINEDIYYNGASLSYARGDVGAEVLPYSEIEVFVNKSYSTNTASVAH